MHLSMSDRSIVRKELVLNTDSVFSDLDKQSIKDSLSLQALRKCMYNHKSTLKEHKSNTVLCQHYNLNDHFHDNNKGFINVMVQIIDYLNENDKKAENNNQILETLEEFHMKRLVSLYPFGFNDKVTSSNDILTKIDLTKFNKK